MDSTDLLVIIVYEMLSRNIAQLSNSHFQAQTSITKILTFFNSGQRSRKFQKLLRRDNCWAETFCEKRYIKGRSSITVWCFTRMFGNYYKLITTREFSHIRVELLNVNLLCPFAIWIAKCKSFVPTKEASRIAIP